MDRWKMNKLGFLNFWLYDQEEFSLSDGHILLRRNNAAGKSITTQSFVPFILDGDRRPERLDPFGSRDRKMEFYLLGDGEQEESTGYLCLEFRKSGTEECRTVGVGMRAQRGKGIDFWGFCLCDGRRIGPGGVQLYEKMDGKNLPLSKQRLRNLVGNQDCWAESPTKYKEMVNDQIFGFRDIRQYDQLVQLLIQVRTPKLSKDFRPSLVKGILNNSLQVLTDDDLSAKRARLQQMQKECASLEAQLVQGKAQLQKLEDGIDRREVRLRNLTQDSEDARTEMRRSIRELNGQNELLQLGQEHTQYIRSLQAERLDADRQPVQTALRQRSRQIGEVLAVLRRAEEARVVYDSACQALDEAADRVREAKIVLGDAQAQEREERDKLLEEFTRKREGNLQLVIPQDTWLDIRRTLTTYRVPADWSPIRNQLDDCFRTCESALRDRKYRADSARTALQTEQNELERQLKQVKDQPEPIPPRRGQIQATRAHLAMRGVPCAPFYELIDFAPELAQEERDLLEAQLLDAGLLDALVVPEASLPEIRELLEEYPDHFLVPGPAVADPIISLIPDGEGRFPKEAAACLRGISRSDLTAETAMLPDGGFRCGMVQGCSQAEGPAGFIGAAARKANRQRQICELEGQLEQLSWKLQAAQAEVAECGEQMDLLGRERTEMPTAEELDQALALLEQSRGALQRAEEERAQKESIEQEAKKTLAELEQRILGQSAGLSYERTISAYEEAQESAAGYQDALNDLDSSRQRLDFALRSAQSEQEGIDEQRNRVDHQKRQIMRFRGTFLTVRPAPGSCGTF